MFWKYFVECFVRTMPLLTGLGNSLSHWCYKDAAPTGCAEHEGAEV